MTQIEHLKLGFLHSIFYGVGMVESKVNEYFGKYHSEVKDIKGNSFVLQMTNILTDEVTSYQFTHTPTTDNFHKIIEIAPI